MCRAIPLLPLRAFVACYGVKYTYYYNGDTAHLMVIKWLLYVCTTCIMVSA